MEEHIFDVADFPVFIEARSVQCKVLPEHQTYMMDSEVLPDSENSYWAS